MKKIVLVMYDSFSEFEITVATAMLKSSFQIKTVAETRQMITGESGLQFMPHLTFSEVDPSEYEGIIIPGGDLIHIKDSHRLYQLTKELHDLKKLTAAICSGTYVLARAGILEDKPYTVTLHQKQREFLGCFKEEYFHYEPVVKAHSVITAQGHAYVEFALAIADHLNTIKDPDYVREFYKGQRNRLMEE
ncbi:DJ-1/PfpI family protein [Ferdinandcohnia sp. Marseille-Q9671]